MSLRIVLAAVALMTLPTCVAGSRSPSPTETYPTTTTTTSTTAPLTPADAAVESFSECLGENGVGVGAIPFDATGRPRLDLFLAGLDLTDPQTVGALSICAGHLTTGALDLTDEPEIRNSVLVALRDFSECVRARGVPDFPDPVEGFIGVGPPYPMAEIPYSDPDLAAAVAGCRERIPTS